MSERFPGLVVGFDDDRVQPRIAGGGFESRRHRVQKTADRGVDFDADDRVVRSGHADVGQIGGALGQDPLVGRLHVRVRADDCRDLAVEKPAHRDFLRGGFGVEVHEDDAGAVTQRLDLPLHDGERVVEAVHEDAAHHVDDADRSAVPRAWRDSCRCRARRPDSWPAVSKRDSAPM